MTTASLLAAAAKWIDVLWAESLYAGVIFVVVLVTSRLLRRRGAAVHLALWSLVFVRLLLPPDLSHPWSLGALLDRCGGQFPMLGASGAKAVGNDAFVSVVVEGSADGRLSVNPELDVLAVLWLLGFATVITVRARRVAPFHKVAGAAMPVTDPALLEATKRWRRRLRIRRDVRVVTSSAGLPPFTVGVVRPIVFLPQSILANQRSVEAAVAHEMAHVARWDALWLELQHVVHAVYFFHPLVWFAGARIEMEREKLCDATVVGAGRLSARRYVSGLLDVLQLDLHGDGAPTLSARKRRIGMRIESIFERDGGPRPRVARSMMVACLVGAVLLPLGRGGARADDTRQVSSPNAPGAPVGTAMSFENPLPKGRVTWRWGPGRDPWSGEKVFHRGIDVAAEAGTPILAPADGIVTLATDHFEPSLTSGTVIVIDHGDGWTTFYAHLESLKVSEGQSVSRGDTIATVGSSGKLTGPHLHFEIRRDGDPLNPADFVSGWKS